MEKIFKKVTEAVEKQHMEKSMGGGLNPPN